MKLTPSVRIRSIAFFGSHTSCSTTLARSMIGIIRPYMKPVWCAIGDAISTTSSCVRSRRSAYGTMLAISVLAECITPLGSPVVPEV